MIVKVNIDRIVLNRPRDAGDARALQAGVSLAVRQHVARAMPADRPLTPMSIARLGESVARKTASEVS